MAHGMTGKKRLIDTAQNEAEDLTESGRQVLQKDRQVLQKDRHAPASPDGGGCWAEALEDFLLDVQSSLEEKTRQFYAERLRLLVRWSQAEASGGQGVTLPSFRAKHLREYMAYRQKCTNAATGKPISDATRRLDAIAARRFLAFAAKEGYISVNPVQDYEIPKASKSVSKCPPDADVQNLLRATQDRWKPALNADARFIHAPGRTFFSRRNYAILSGLVTTACRISEMLALRTSDFDLESGTVHFRDTKGDQDRIVPFEPGWGQIVSHWLKVRPAASPADTLFVTEFGDAISVDRFRHQFYKDCDFAGVSLNLHALRHYALTQIGKKGLFAAQKIAGHKSPSTTQLYLHSDAAHLADIHAQAAPLGRLLEPAQKPVSPILVNKRSAANKRRKLV